MRSFGLGGSRALPRNPHRARGQIRRGSKQGTNRGLIPRGGKDRRGRGEEGEGGEALLQIQGRGRVAVQKERLRLQELQELRKVSHGSPSGSGNECVAAQPEEGRVDHNAFDEWLRQQHQLEMPAPVYDINRQ
ncbi:hypothetical protein ACHAWF_004255 [Thalassiosira exigua]